MVLFFIEREKISKQTAAISEVTGQSKTQGKKSFCLLKNPNTLILEVFPLGSNNCSSISCQAYGISGTPVKPDSSK
jgi:hypothetical protein